MWTTFTKFLLEKRTPIPINVCLQNWFLNISQVLAAQTEASMLKLTSSVEYIKRITSILLWHIHVNRTQRQTYFLMTVIKMLLEVHESPHTNLFLFLGMAIISLLFFVWEVRDLFSFLQNMCIFAYFHVFPSLLLSILFLV